LVGRKSRAANIFLGMISILSSTSKKNDNDTRDFVSSRNYYTINQFEDMKNDKKIDLTEVLSNVKQIIEGLEHILCVSAPIKSIITEDHQKEGNNGQWIVQSRGRGRGRGQGQGQGRCQFQGRGQFQGQSQSQNQIAAVEESWKVPKLKKTILISEDGKKDPINEIIQKICISMNKITVNNYDRLKVDIIAEIFVDDPEDTYIEKIAKKFMDIVLLNKSCTQVYARLFLEILQYAKNGSFSGVCFIFQKSFLEIRVNYELSLQEIQFIDPNKDYDGYCAYVKKNESRKASVLFIIHVLELIIESNSIENEHERENFLDMIHSLQENISNYIAEENKVNDVEEMIEILYLFITTNNIISANPIKEKEIVDKIEKISSSKSRDFKSLSSRAIFKSMDILDFIKKRKVCL
jgi:hypothetical protein